MFDRYPSCIETIINSEKIYQKYAPLLGDTIEEFLEDRRYVINGNLSIKDCLVFDNTGKFIDGYSTISSNEYYKDKLFLDWMS